MRSIRTALIAFGIAGLLTACGSQGGDTTVQSTTQAPPAPVTVLTSGSDTAYGKDAVRKCNTAYIPVEVGVGTHTEADAEYKLSEIRGAKNSLYNNVQQAVKLYAKPPAGVTIPAAIVHAAGSSDREVALSVNASGIVDMELKTAKYAYLSDHYQDYPISSITLCTKRTS